MSTDRLNRRDLIVDTAAELFMTNGYSATSVRQIAEVVGVTEAALYYHFKGGKRELLEAVFEQELPDFKYVVSLCGDAATFQDFLHCLVTQFRERGKPVMERFRWILSEYPNFSEEERLTFQSKHVIFQQEVAGVLVRFVDDPEDARVLSSLIISLFIGYSQIFWHLEIEKIIPISPEKLIETLLKYMKL